VVLFTALIGPYFINWTSYRTSFEREASRYFGQPVTVAGRADLRLLPTPILSFTDVRLGDPEEPYVVVERFRAEVELAPLLKGEINVLDMTIERPSLQIDLAGLDQLAGAKLPDHKFNPEKIALNDVEIVQGEALVLDSRTGRQWSVSNINAVVDAKSLAGPAKFEAGLIFDGQPVTVRAATGRRNPDDTISLNLTVIPARRLKVVRVRGQNLEMFRPAKRLMKAVWPRSRRVTAPTVLRPVNRLASVRFACWAISS